MDKNNLENTIYELILGECSISDCIIKKVVDNVSVLPSNVNLAAAEIELIGIDKKDEDKLFQSFSQVDASISRTYGGTGNLSLIIIRGCLKASPFLLSFLIE